MSKEVSIVWFRQDLRLSDNSAISKASSIGSILPIYVWDDAAPNLFKIGSASKVWLHHSLEMLNKSLHGNLNIYLGNPSDVIKKLTKQYEIKHVFCNKCYEPWQVKQEKEVKTFCKQHAIDYESFNGCYLWKPEDVLKNDQSYYKVFSAYKKKALFLSSKKKIEKAGKLSLIKDSKNKKNLSALNLLPQKKKWHQKMIASWNIGEEAAKKKLQSFFKTKLSGYQKGRDFPATNSTSLLSPHLHFGEISPSQILEALQNSKQISASKADRENFFSELIWREFSGYLLYHFPSLHKDNFNPRFNRFPWKNHTNHLKAWQKGNTGYPIVDAGMRELWQTGYMHNRVRMIVASFLVKNLHIHWHKGRDWFWDCLVDADLANNSASWQWVAGCGVDAAPYFRIFNPVTQGEKFDKSGEYTRKFVPELKKLPDKYLFKPWMAPEKVLESSGIILGETYPEPIVDLTTSRNEALKAYKSL